MGEHFPTIIDGAFTLCAEEHGHIVPGFAEFRQGGVVFPGSGNFCGLITRIENAVEGRGTATAADSKVHGTVVRIDHKVGHGHGFALGEDFIVGGIGGACGGQMDGKHTAIGPVAEVHGVLVFGREFGAIAKDDTGGAAPANVGDDADGVRVIFWPLPCPPAPTEFGTVNGVGNTGRAVPGSADVVLHVGVVDEEFAMVVVGEVVGIAVADGVEPDVVAAGLEADDKAARSFAAGVVAVVSAAWEEVVFVPVLHHIDGDVCGKVGVVPGEVDDSFAVGAEDQGMGMVVAAHSKADEVLNFVVLVVTSAISEPEDATLGFGFSGDVEATEGAEDAIGASDFNIESLNMGLAIF